MEQNDSRKDYHKQWRENHKDYHKDYYENHKDDMKKKIIEKAGVKILCECGKFVRRGYLKYHTERNLHKKLLNKKLAE